MINNKTLIFVSLVFISFSSFSFVQSNKTYDFDFFLARDIGTQSEIREELKKVAREDLVCSSARNCTRLANFSYSQAREFVYFQVDSEEDDLGYFVTEKYCHQRVDLGFRKDELVMPNHNNYNIEHTFPRSWIKRKYSKGSSMYRIGESDMHHLYPTQNKANGIRGSHEFGDVSRSGKGSDRLCFESKIGSSRDGRGLVFSPPAEHQGNVARAVFYMAIKYDFEIRGAQEKTLRLWNILDPVDKAEMRRNEVIHRIQGNRNPFIDHPEMIDKIDNF